MFGRKKRARKKRAELPVLPIIKTRIDHLVQFSFKENSAEIEGVQADQALGLLGNSEEREFFMRAVKLGVTLAVENANSLSELFEPAVHVKRKLIEQHAAKNIELLIDNWVNGDLRVKQDLGFLMLLNDLKG